MRPRAPPSLRCASSHLPAPQGGDDAPPRHPTSSSSASCRGSIIPVSAAAPRSGNTERMDPRHKAEDDGGGDIATAIAMPLVHSQRIQPLAELCPPSKTRVFYSPFRHTGGLVWPAILRRLERMERERVRNGQRRHRLMERCRRIEGDTRSHSGRGSQTPSTRRRLMGLGDKTAIARRPVLGLAPRISRPTFRAERRTSSKR